MDTKTEKMQKAINNVKQRKIVLYHIIDPIDNVKFNQIKNDGYFDFSDDALGGQSNGYYFFTTNQGAQHYIDWKRGVWKSEPGKTPYIVECEVDFNKVSYPTWKLDYESMQDFLFDMIYDAASRQNIKLKNIEIKSEPNKKLNVIVNGTFSRITSFVPDKHSGLIEQVADLLYRKDKQFKQEYDNLLKDVFLGQGGNPELYAVKTTTKQKITKITAIETNNTPQPSSQIDKFFSRYGRGKRK